MADLPARIGAAIAEAETTSRGFLALNCYEPAVHDLARQVLRAAEVDRALLDWLVERHPWPKAQKSYAFSRYWFSLAERYGVGLDA